MMNTANPQQIGQYLLEEQIGQGGMGKVYRAQHPTLKRTVAIKLILNQLTTDATTRDRFEREAQTVAQLRHPNILAVYDYGVDDDRAYMVLEYIAGGTLQELIKARGALSQDDALRIAGQIAAALDYAHQQGIVHRDLKPANIMFTDNTHHQAVLTDFGLVRVLGSTIETEHGSFVGTPAYISPEVIAGEPATPPSDMYALGLILVEMLTGKPVAPAGNIGALLLWHIRGKRPDLSGLGLPPNLIDLITRSLNPTPTQRPTAADVIAVLRGNDDTRASGDDTLAGDTRLLFEQMTPALEARLIGNLPLNFDKQRRFVGRDEQIGALQSALTQRQRVIAVVGKSGIGKSALVSKVLADMLHDTAMLDGIVAVSARSGDDQVIQINLDGLLADFHALLPSADLGANPQESLHQQAQRILNATREGRYVLLLDNLESIQADDHSVTEPGIAALLEAVLEQGGLTVVITSQLPLRMKGVGKNAHITLLALDHGLSADAALLFLHSLWASTDRPSDDELRRLIQQVEGHPRALEAATDWLRENPLNTLDDLLDEIAHQQGDVVTQLVSKSIDNLPMDMQRILAAIAIFEGHAAVAAVEQVIAPFVTGSVRENLNRLVLRRFVRFDASTRTLDLHTLDRAYSRSLLPPTDADESVYGRYALLRRAAAYFEGIRKPEAEWKQYDDLRPQLNEFDFRMALGEYDTAADLVLAMGNDYLIVWGYARQVAAMHARLQGKIEHRGLAQRSAGNLGTAFRVLGRVKDSIPPSEKALQLAREDNDKWGEGAGLGNLGSAYYSLGDLPTAIDYYQQALIISRDIGDKRGEGNYTGNLGIAYRNLGDLPTAIDFYQQALTISRDIGDKLGEGNYLGNLGIAYVALGDLPTAIDFYQQALTISQDIGHKRGEGNHLGNLGIAYATLGDIHTAIDYYQQALTISQDIGHKRGEGNHLGNLGIAYSNLGDITTAIDFYQQALTISQDIGHKRGEGNHLGNLGIAYSNLGDITTAIDYHQQTLTISRDIGDKRAEGAALGYLGRDLAERGDFQAAVQHIQQGLDVARNIQSPYLEAGVTYDLAQVLLIQGNLSAADESLTAAADLDVAEFKHQIAVLRGVAALRLGQPDAARTAFTDAITAADEVLVKTEQYWMARYALGLAQAGLALLDGTPIADAIETYRLARENCDAAGVLRDQRRWLDLLIESDGGAILQSVREVLG